MVAAVRFWPRSNEKRSVDYTEVAIAAVEQYAAGSVANGRKRLQRSRRRPRMCESPLSRQRAIRP